MSTPRAQVLSSQSRSPLKEPESPEEMADWTAGAKERKDEPGLYYVRKQGHVRRMMESCQKDTETSINELQWAKWEKLSIGLEAIK